MNNQKINEINFKLSEIEEGLEQMHKLSTVKTISAIYEVQETKESILAKQKAVIDLIDVEIEKTEDLNLFDSLITNNKISKCNKIKSLYRLFLNLLIIFNKIF